MLRLFKTHDIRKQIELTGLWDFTPSSGENAGHTISAAVPGCWECIPGFENYRGMAEYSKSFTGGGNIRIVFKGVSHTAEIFFDEKRVAGHYNAYTPFDAIVTSVPDGEHTIRVKVSNEHNEASSLHVSNDYYTYGGINRPVAVEFLQDVYITHVHATPLCINNEWSLQLAIGIRNIGKNNKTVTAAVSLNNTRHTFEPETINAGEEMIITGEVRCPGVESYDSYNPVLYNLHTCISIDKNNTGDGSLCCPTQGTVPCVVFCDDLIERIGFRVVEVSGREVLWNGKPILIKGFNRHEDHPDYGNALPFQAMVNDIKLMKDMGANAVRTSHYPNDELFLDLCDEFGLMVWEENHSRGLSEEQMRNPNFRSQIAECNREMVYNHFNHPSIFIWGIMNECENSTEYGRECYAEQFKQIRSLDSSRPVSFASFKFLSDICLDLVDIVSYNIYPRWYNETPVAEYLQELMDWVEKAGGRGKPFLITEIGAGGIYGYRNPGRRAKWTEERHADILEEQLNAIFNNTNVSGVFIWQYCDIRVDEDWAMRRPRSMNNKGIVDEYRRKKLAYETVKEIFAKNK